MIPDPVVASEQSHGGLRWPPGVALELVILHAALLFTVVALTPASELLPNHGDVILYFQYAERVMQGDVPYRDVFIAYPPLSLVAFLLPYVAWPVRPLTLETYQWLFLTQNAILSTAIALTVGWIGHRWNGVRGMVQAMGLYAVMAAVMAPLIAWRYEPLPVLLSVGGAALAIAGKPTLAGAALGLGFAAKVFPVVLLPVVCLYFIAEGRVGFLLRAALGFAAAASAAWLPIAVLAPNEFASFATLQQERPIQIESIQGGLYLLSHLLGSDIQITADFGSVNVHASGSSQAIDLQGIVSLAALAGTFGLFYLRLTEESRRMGSVSIRTLIEASAAVLLALILTNKVFSTSYVLWLLPFAALLPRPQAYLSILAALLSMIVFPLNYAWLIALEPTLIIVLNVRNALLLLLLVTLLVGPARLAALGRLIPSRRARAGPMAPT